MNKIKSVIDYREGAVVRLLLSSPDIKENRIYRCEAVVDTGAEYTVISKSSAQYLNLPVVKKANLIQPSGSVITDAVEAKLDIINDEEESVLRFDRIRVITATMEGHLDGFIGRDILKQCKLFYDGKKQEFSLEA